MNQIPGTTFMGLISNPEINDGQPIPLLAPVDRPNGINTLNGWNALADRINRKSFRQAHGREPKDKAELDAWVVIA